MKILIISSIIYPRSRPRAIRATQLAKELAKRGHEVILYGNLGNFDYTEFERQNNIRIENLGPTVFFTKNSSEDIDHPFYKKLIIRLFKKPFLLPQRELEHLAKRATLREENVDLLISLAAPHPIHWGVANAKKIMGDKFAKVWIADSGDPFSGNPLQSFPKKFVQMENQAFQQSDFMTIPVEEAIDSYDRSHRSKIKVIPQGFDFEEVSLPEYQKNNVPTFIYGGVFYEQIRNPIPFLDFLLSLEQDFKFTIYTKLNNPLISKYIDLDSRIIFKDFISRDQLLKEMATSDFLVNFKNKDAVQSPSKLIDYGIANRPILDVEHNQVNSDLVKEFFEGNYSNKTVIPNLDNYRIETVTDQFLQLYDEKINQGGK